MTVSTPVMLLKLVEALAPPVSEVRSIVSWEPMKLVIVPGSAVSLVILSVA